MQAVGVLGDRTEQLQPQPLRVAEQARVRELAHREVELHLVDGDVEAGAEAEHVLREDRRSAVRGVEQGNPDVAAGDYLARELADDLPQLHGEQGAADVAHHAAHAGDHPVHLLGLRVGGALLENLHERVGYRVGHRLGELRPHRHGRGDPLLAADQPRFGAELRDRRDLVEPQGCHVQSLLELRALGGQRNDGAPGRDALRLFEGEPPVDAVAAGVDRVLQLGHELGDHGRVVGQPRGSRELRRVDVAVALEELAQHLAELFCPVAALSGLP